MPLSNEDRDRIRQEEIFRDEVRKEIERSSKGKSRGTGILSFLNSPFGIFLLSTVVIGVISTAYNSTIEHRKEQDLRHAQAVELNVEIVNRMRALDSDVSAAGVGKGLFDSVDDDLNYSSTWQSDDPHYSNTATGLLLSHLEDDVDGVDAQDVEKCIQAWGQMQTLSRQTMAKLREKSRMVHFPLSWQASHPQFVQPAANEIHTLLYQRCRLALSLAIGQQP